MYKVYKITNIVNGSIYIGITKKPINERLKQHFSESKRKKSILYYQMQKYEKENFIIEEIDNCNSLNEAIEKETFYINKFRSNKLKFPESNGMNMNDGGITPPNNKGKKLFNFIKLRNRNINEEIRKKISESLKNHYKNLSNEERKKRCSRKLIKRTSHKNSLRKNKTNIVDFIEKRKSRKLSEETKKKISQKLKGRKKSEETKLKISISNKFFCNKNKIIKKPRDNHNLQYITEEYRKKLSNSLKNRIFSENHRKKLSEALKGVKYKNSKIILLNKNTGEEIEFRNLKDVSKYINFSVSFVSKMIRTGKDYNNISIKRIFSI